MKGDSPVFSLNEVLAAVAGELISGSGEIIFRGISTDSRSIREGNLFVALKGENFDGHDFARTAYDQGAAGILIHDRDKVAQLSFGEKFAVIGVGDTLMALGNLARAWRIRFSIPVIGLTGSSGKTTTKEMMASIIGRKKKVLKTEGNLNNLVGLPQTIFRLTGEHELAILEMGTNTPGEIKRLTQIAAPDIGLITNIGPAHLEGFGTMEAVKKEKGDLFLNMPSSGAIIINRDDEAVVSASEKWRGRTVTFSMSPNADVTVNDIEKIGAKGIRFNLVVGGNVQRMEMKIAGLHHVYNAMAAAAAALAANMDLKTIVEGLSAFRPFSGRMEIIKLRNGAFVIDDSYNANPASVREALLTLKDLKVNRNSYVFLGDMLELGSEAPEMHRKIGMLMATIGVNALFLQGEFSRVTAGGAVEGGMAPENIFFLSGEEEGIDFLKKNLKKGDWILIKGSRLMKMEKYTARICEEFGGTKLSKEKNSNDLE